MYALWSSNSLHLYSWCYFLYPPHLFIVHQNDWHDFTALRFLSQPLNLWTAVDFDTPKYVGNSFNECFVLVLWIHLVFVFLFYDAVLDILGVTVIYISMKCLNTSCDIFIPTSVYNFYTWLKTLTLKSVVS